MTETAVEAAPVPESVVAPDPAVQKAQEIISAAIRDATFEDLFAKPRRTTSFEVSLPASDGGVQKVRIRYRAISAKEYDDLLAAHPPTKKSKEEGQIYNHETFPPALIAAVSLAPKLTVEQAAELYNHPDWSGGEVSTLFYEALGVCNGGLSVPFNAGDLRDDPTFRIEAGYAVERGIPYSEYIQRWDHNDRDIVIAVKTENAQRCSSCGSADWEWLEDPDAYLAMNTVCLGCAARDRATSGRDDARVPGSSVRLIPKEQAARILASPASRPLSRRERAKQ